MTQESDIVVASERLDAFAAELTATITTYRRSIDMLQESLSRLSRTWRDERFREFSSAFARTRDELEAYIDEARRAREQVLQHAEDARAIERVRLGGGI